MNIQEHVANRIRTLVNTSGYRYGFIAEKAGIDPKKFSAMLTGRKIIELQNITPIANALGVTPNDLLDVTDERVGTGVELWKE